MESYLIYFFKVIALQTILFGFYWFLSRKSTGFHFNRYFLLGTLLLPFFIPLLNIPFTFFSSQASNDSFFDPWYFIEQSLPIVTIKGGQLQSGGSSWWMFLLTSVYLVVTIPAMLKMIYDYIRIRRLENTSIRKEYSPKGFRLLYVPTKILSFSFWNRIFLSDLFPLKKEEKKTIVTHEEYHLTQLHSLDIILAELVWIVCWFNPIVRLIQRNLKETHEYLADWHTIKHYGKNDYAALLKSFKWQEINMLLGNAYSSSSIKNRLRMMERSDKRYPVYQGLLLTILTIFTVFLFACERELDSFDERNSSFQYELSEADLEQEINNQLARLEHAPKDLRDYYMAIQRKHPENIYLPDVIWISENQLFDDIQEKIKAGFKMENVEIEVEFLRMLEKDETNLFFSNEQISKIEIKGSFAVIRKADRMEYMEYYFKLNQEDNNIYKEVDQLAGFNGGMSALAQHLKENLKYPELAKERGIEDKLIMRFVVTKLGGLVYLNVEQPPSTTDEEVSLEFQKAAFHALHTTEGKWKPAEKNGKYVMSKMTLPIEFKLDE